MMGLFKSGTLFLYMLMLLLVRTCQANDQHIHQIYPGFSASRLDWNNHNGFFLLSNNSAFAFGFFTTLDVSLFVLVVIHLSSYKVVWTANRGLLVRDSDKFVFDHNGNVYLESGNGLVWETKTSGQKVRDMELLDSGNLVLFGEKGSPIWQSFNHPTDTLLAGQFFVEGMTLKSFPNSMNLFHYLGYIDGDLVLYAGFEKPQLYWSLMTEVSRTSKNNVTKGKVHYASLVSNSLNFYDKSGGLVWKTLFSDNSDPKSFFAAILDPNGAISFYDLNKGKSTNPEVFKLPQDPCGIPEPCDPYYVCFFENWCECPSLLRSRFNCKPPNISTCSSSTELLYVGEDLDYFALKYDAPVLKSTLNSCKEACVRNCSCLVLFYENSTGSCFHFDQTGSFQRFKGSNGGYISYMKVSTDNVENDGKNSSGKKNMLLVFLIVILTVLVIVGLLTGFWCYYKKKNFDEYLEDKLEEDEFFDSLSSMPARFTYSTLARATKDFSTKIGEGGFGSVYLGVLEDETQLAVKKLEGVGQGAKEFKAEVSIIGSIHHVHLVKLKGFCAEGPHRLLVYEYLARGSLDKWIFKNSENTLLLTWDTRYNIAIGTAKGLAYLHEECEVRIIHCDIKPQNVLLDDNFMAKVSDFGLAKLMSREQSHVFTTLRGTRGYLAPEWITNYAISEKSDVFSYGMLLLEIVGGRKNYDQWEGAEKAHFPSYVSRMMEEGKLREVVDKKIDIDDKDERVGNAIKIALWCIQDDMNLRPCMSKVAQMLEGLCHVPDPPSLLHSSTFSAFLKMSSGEATSSGQASIFSNVPLSCVQLSGPR